MNWVKIHRECPKAHNEAMLWKGSWESFNTRDLYDFFDERGIKCQVICGPSSIPNGFIWGIYNVAIGKPTPTRPEAEEAAFTEAFRILESKLQDSTQEEVKG